MTTLETLRNLVEAIYDDTGHGDVGGSQAFKDAESVLSKYCHTCESNKGKPRLLGPNRNPRCYPVLCDECLAKLVAPDSGQ